MPKHGLEYLQSPEKARFEALARYAFLVAAIPRARRYEALAKADLGILDATYISKREGQGRVPFIFVKSTSLDSEHSAINQVTGAIHAAATPFTRRERQKGNDEWRSYLHLFRPRGTDPLHRNYTRPGELWVVGGYRPELPDCVDAMYANLQGFEKLPGTIKNGRNQTKPSIVSQAALWRRQFPDVSEADVMVGSAKIEAAYYEEATFWGDVTLLATASRRLREYNHVLETGFSMIDDNGGLEGI